MTYAEKLKSPKWQKKRLEILSRDEFTCKLCGDTEETLHVHHLKYEKGKHPADIDSKHLITYCAECHQIVEANKHLIFKKIIKRYRNEKDKREAILHCFALNFLMDEKVYLYYLRTDGKYTESPQFDQDTIIYIKEILDNLE